MSPESPALSLLRAMLTTGPAVDMSGRSPVYRRPTLTTMREIPMGAPISARADTHIRFAFTEPGGETVSYSGSVSQDDLFRALHSAGLLHREGR